MSMTNNDNDDLTPEQEAELIQFYGPEGPDAFRENLKNLKQQFPGFFESGK